MSGPPIRRTLLATACEAVVKVVNEENGAGRRGAARETTSAPIPLDDYQDALCYLAAATSATAAPHRWKAPTVPMQRRSRAAPTAAVQLRCSLRSNERLLVPRRPWRSK